MASKWGEFGILNPVLDSEITEAGSKLMIPSGWGKIPPKKQKGQGGGLFPAPAAIQYSLFCHLS